MKKGILFLLLSIFALSAYSQEEVTKKLSAEVATNNKNAITNKTVTSESNNSSTPAPNVKIVNLVSVDEIKKKLLQQHEENKKKQKNTIVVKNDNQKKRIMVLNLNSTRKKE